MKSQHRHDLQTNDLSRLTEKAGRHLEAYGTHIFFVLIAVIAIAIGTVYWMRLAKTTQVAGWTEMQGSRSAGEFANIAENYPDSPVGNWARLKEAEQNLQSGIQLSFTDRQAGLSDLSNARKGFEELLKADASDTIRQRALFGLARTLETTGGADLNPALEAYAKVKTSYPKSVLAELAGKRIEALESSEAQSFYAWFQKQSPKPPDRELPRDGRVPGQPGFPAEFEPTGDMNTDESALPPGPDSLPIFPAQAGDASVSEDSATGTPTIGEEENTTLPPVSDDKPAEGKDADAKGTADPALPADPTSPVTPSEPQ